MSWCDELPLAQASVSRHVKALKEARLVRGEIDGPRSCYCLVFAGTGAVVVNAMVHQHI